ncbi:uncharacterized protein BX664DRAFT_263219 [Halteromyces radiatus]|uniref:uncharacterized protein n=1 Tax=Halteromyces radiatus TaxID=101107 RepID=UPI002220354B|nr:uncharacterized protein BX664DRAFT_263219 [Halteromyces radiatus]KAI8089905.1 hypothetical protein BX664DRAFT_263219 [Halteromyces radiatus]
MDTGSTASSFITQGWNRASNQFYASQDVSFVNDPINNNSTQVMRVVYGMGSYAPSGTRSNQGSQGGTEFFSAPFGNKSYDSVLVRYDLAFDNSFQWVQGGKLPGVFGGVPGSGCSGGNAADGSNCFSVRLMWRQNGAGEAYAYIPNTGDVCKQTGVMCNDQYGTSFSRGVIQFTQNKWTTMEIYVKINNASSSNGILTVWQDGNIVVNQQQLQYRTSNAIAVSSLFFSTFFGGGDPSYASPVDTYTYFKNIQFSVGNQVELSNSGAELSFKSPISWIFVVALVTLSILI